MIPAITRQLRHTARGIRASADVIEAVAARHRVKRAPRGISAAYDFATSFRYGEIELTPFQIRAEFEALLSRVQGLKPLRVLEIGTARGGTLFLLTRVADPHAIIVSVDMKDGPFGGGYPWRWIPLLRAFGRDTQSVRLVRGNSHEEETLRKVSTHLGGQLDFLFIDGDHSFDGVSRDFEMYASLVRSGGLIALHDIARGPAEIVGEVPRFWERLRSQESMTEEIVADRNQGGWGIGLVRR